MNLQPPDPPEDTRTDYEIGLDEGRASQWIPVGERLPNDDCPAWVYTPAMNGEDERYECEHYLEDEGGWSYHANHYEHYCMVAKGGSGVSWTGPSEKAKYTHWMPRHRPQS